MRAMWPHRLAFCPTREGLGLTGWDLQVRFLLGPQRPALPAPASGPVAVGIAPRAAAAEPWLLAVSPSFLSFRYSPKSPALQSETVHYKRGVSQQFSLPSFKIDFSEWKDDEVTSWPLA